MQSKEGHVDTPDLADLGRSATTRLKTRNYTVQQPGGAPQLEHELAIRNVRRNAHLGARSTRRPPGQANNKNSFSSANKESKGRGTSCGNEEGLEVEARLVTRTGRRISSTTRLKGCGRCLLLLIKSGHLKPVPSVADRVFCAFGKPFDNPVPAPTPLAHRCGDDGILLSRPRMPCLVVLTPLPWHRGGLGTARRHTHAAVTLQACPPIAHRII
mmetsp:Transcript_18123/g.38932  ORF Transcript_18123/g.38932 Transcript_18123/m.38932 type:complete len:214 (-) Transcript_18123:614-1255(-)